MATWPDYGYYMQPIRQHPSTSMVERSQMEHGPPKQSQKPGRILMATELRVLFTPTEYTNWLAWYRDTIMHGAAKFTWTDPMDGVAKTAWIKGGDFQVSTYGNRAGPGIKRIVELTVEAFDA